MLRLLRFSFPYQEYVSAFYRSRPGLELQSYSQQASALNEDFAAGVADSLTAALRPLGYETRDYALSVEPLQKAWARKHAIPYRETNWELDIAREQVLRFRPEVLMVNPYAVPAEWIRLVRAECPSIRCLVARHSSPRPDLSLFQLCDLVVSGDTDQVAELRNSDVNAIHLHHAFDARVLRRLPSQVEPAQRVLFTGTINRHEGFHLYRTEILRHIVSSGIPTELRIPLDTSFKTMGKGRAKRLLWDFSRVLLRMGIPHDKLFRFRLFASISGMTGRPPAQLERDLRRRVQPPVFGLDMYRALQSRAVILNVHGDVSATQANNLRLWEAPGVGTCLLTDHKENLHNLYEIDEEVVTYSSAEDCADRARWLIDHPKERDEIARAGQARVLREHTYEHRAPLFDHAIRQSL